MKPIEGYKLISRDSESAEYRIIAAMTNDQVLLEMFKNKEDIHQINADIIKSFGIAADRDRGKLLSYIGLYGGSAIRLKKELGASEFDCEKILEYSLADFPNVRRWHKDMQEIASTTRQTVGMFGRKAEIIGEFSARKVRNKLLNYGPAGTLSLYQQLALQDFRKKMKSQNMWGEDKVRSCNFIHDEQLAVAKNEFAQQANEQLKDSMENCYDLGVDMPSKGGIIQSWDLAK